MRAPSGPGAFLAHPAQAVVGKAAPARGTAVAVYSGMLSIRRILCPVDFSAFSRHALDLAFALAARHGAEITALHVTAASRPSPAAVPT